MRVPLAFAQEPMWFAQELDPGSPTFNAYEAFRLRGTVDAGELQSVLSTIVHRHEILRTAFQLIDGDPSQLVLPAGAFPLEVLERRDLEPEAGDFEMLLGAFVRRPFSFADGAMARALLVRLRGDESVLVLVLHHLVRDGWSMGVLLDEISRLFAAPEESDAALAPLTIQYGDYAIWQRALLADGAFDAQRAYWVERLAGAPSVLELPSDRQRGESDRGAGGVCSIEIEPSVVTALRVLAGEMDASYFMVLMAAFQTYLHRYTGRSDVLTGFPVSGRAVPETEPQLGCFTNTVVLRTQFEPGATFRDVLARVRNDALDAYDNRDYPIEKLIADLRPERRPGMNPLVQTLVTRIDPRRPKLRLPGVAVEQLPPRIGRPKVDLALEMIDARDGGLTCRFEYAGALFDQATAFRMLEHFGILLAAA
ncbi:MAG TPA: condensation domain-containing protein, partial [Candidatus Elarobacter sp.]|nr:condensation domain-containing protein [Candidatus Elarobacter sp.]